MSNYPPSWHCPECRSTDTYAIGSEGWQCGDCGALWPKTHTPLSPLARA